MFGIECSNGFNLLAGMHDVAVLEGEIVVISGWNECVFDQIELIPDGLSVDGVVDIGRGCVTDHLLKEQLGSSDYKCRIECGRSCGLQKRMRRGSPEK